MKALVGIDKLALVPTIIARFRYHKTGMTKKQ